MRAERRQRVADGGQKSLPWPPSRSEIDSAGTAGDEFARNAESARLADVSVTAVECMQIIRFCVCGAEPLIFSGGSVQLRWLRVGLPNMPV